MNFTRQERQVMIFLMAVVMLGIGVNFVAKKSGSAEGVSFLNADIGKVDLNNADKDLLLGVPGIGQKLTQRIIAYRDRQGAFESVEELKNIKGMTNYRYQKIKDSFVIRAQKEK